LSRNMKETNDCYIIQPESGALHRILTFLKEKEIEYFPLYNSALR